MTSRISIIGLGPAGLDRLRPVDVDRMMDPASSVIVRTLEHPASSELAGMRPVVTCDDLYEAADDFDDVYDAIVNRVIDAARVGPVVYAVPGSAIVGERAATRLVAEADREEIPCVVVPGESFIDLACATVGIDPIADGLQILDNTRNVRAVIHYHQYRILSYSFTDIVDHTDRFFTRRRRCCSSSRACPVGLLLGHHAGSCR